MSPSPKRPYLLRAMHEWMLDNGLTPHVVVDAQREGLSIPREHVKEGKIVLNLSPSATRSLTLGNELVSFEARFGGVSRQLEIPVSAVLGIYARENGQGMIFTEEEPPSDPDPKPPDSPGSDGPRDSGGSRPKLKVVK
jgi:stringent starvation protein B